MGLRTWGYGIYTKYMMVGWWSVAGWYYPIYWGWFHNPRTWNPVLNQDSMEWLYGHFVATVQLFRWLSWFSTARKRRAEDTRKYGGFLKWGYPCLSSFLVRFAMQIQPSSASFFGTCSEAPVKNHVMWRRCPFQPGEQWPQNPSETVDYHRELI